MPKKKYELEMTKIHVRVPKECADKILKRAKQKGFASLSEYIRFILHNLA